VTVEELRTRLREGKIDRPEKVEQALTNFFRKANLSTLRELERPDYTQRHAKSRDLRA
jgi:two-component system sensor histidine kinase KdpD